MSDPSLQIIVGENQRRCGLAVAADGNFELRILVLPKVWQPQEESRPLYWETKQHGEFCLSIVCWEGNRVRLDRIPLDSPRTSQLVACIWKMVRKAQQRIEDEEQAKRDNPNDSDDTSPFTEEGVAPTALVKLASGSEKAFTLPKAETASDFDQYWNDFYGLWYFSRRNRSDYDSQRWIRVWESLGVISGSRVTQVLLVPFLHHAFVTHIESLLRQFRPGYTRMTAASPFVRGRMDVVSASMVASGAGTKCKCTFDFFGLDGPITQVVAAALRVVCNYAGDIRQFPNTNEKAQWLAGHLPGVSVLNAHQAMRQGVSLRGRLGKSDMAWTGALELSCDVLDRHRGLSPSAGAHTGPFGWSRRGDEGFVFDIDTATIWQNIVQSVWPSSAGVFKEAVHPWVSSSGKFGRGMKADDVRHSATEVTIIDSKYKKRPAKKPPASDQRQMFAYAHTYRDMLGSPPKTAACWLVYPEFKWDPRTSDSERKTDLLVTGDKKATLVCIEALFPQPEDTRNQGRWNMRLREMRDSLREVMK